MGRDLGVEGGEAKRLGDCLFSCFGIDRGYWRGPINCKKTASWKA